MPFLAVFGSVGQSGHSHTSSLSLLLVLQPLALAVVDALDISRANCGDLIASCLCWRGESGIQVP